MSDRFDPLEDYSGDHPRPLIMGILNVTPDSFYDGGRYSRLEQAVERAREMAAGGADLIDIGGESTRPGASPVPEAEERQRVVPVIETLREEGLNLPISVDTRKASVARRAIEAGADWINDVTALRGDDAMVDVLADTKTPVVLMHMQGTPETMQEDPRYDDVIEDILDFFRQRLNWCAERGIDIDRVIIDPGIGFGKTGAHNRRILRKIDRFCELGTRVLVGHSRKSFLEPVLDAPAGERLTGTLGVSAHLMRQSVDVLRVHDVAEHRDLRDTLSWLWEDPDRG